MKTNRSQFSRHKVHHKVLLAREVYSVPGFNSHKDVHKYENALAKMGSIDEPTRLTCTSCGHFKGSEHKNHGEQGMLF